MTGGGTQGSAAFQNYYTEVDFQPAITTAEVTTSPVVAPGSFTDSATLSGLNSAGTAVGTVTYNLYAGNTGTVCTGTPLQSVAETVAGGVVPNATFTGVAAGNYEIQAVYSGDPTTFNLGATSTCGTEPFTVNNQPTLTTAEVTASPMVAPASFTDSATLSGLNSAGTGRRDRHLQPLLGQLRHRCARARRPQSVVSHRHRRRGAQRHLHGRGGRQLRDPGRLLR